MTTDEKLGLIVGVAFVVAIAVLFFPKSPPHSAVPNAAKVEAPKPSAAALPTLQTPPPRHAAEQAAPLTDH